MTHLIFIVKLLSIQFSLFHTTLHSFNYPTKRNYIGNNILYLSTDGLPWFSTNMETFGNINHRSTWLVPHPIAFVTYLWIHGICMRAYVCVCVYFLTLSQPLCHGKSDRQYPKTIRNHFLQNSFQFIFTIILSVGKLYQMKTEIRNINQDNFQLRYVRGFWTQSRTENN